MTETDGGRVATKWRLPKGGATERSDDGGLTWVAESIHPLGSFDPKSNNRPRTEEDIRRQEMAQAMEYLDRYLKGECE